MFTANHDANLAELAAGAAFGKDASGDLLRFLVRGGGCHQYAIQGCGRIRGKLNLFAPQLSQRSHGIHSAFPGWKRKQDIALQAKRAYHGELRARE